MQQAFYSKFGCKPFSFLDIFAGDILSKSFHIILHIESIYFFHQIGVTGHDISLPFFLQIDYGFKLKRRAAV